MVFRGQIWRETNDNPVDIFVCGVNGDWVYYTFINPPNRFINDSYPRIWQKSKVMHFEKKYTFTKHAIAPKAYWKKRANGDIVQIIDVKDDGYSKIQVFYDLSKISLRDFYEYFEPCNRVEVLVSLAREKQINKKMKKMKNRIAMSQGRYYYPEEQ